jgi:hypothetical protein
MVLGIMGALFNLLFVLANVAAGFSARRWASNALLAIFVCIFVPPLLAFIVVGPQELLTERPGEVHGWAIMGFFLGVIIGLPACVVGAVLGYFARPKAAMNDKRDA